MQTDNASTPTEYKFTKQVQNLLEKIVPESKTEVETAIKLIRDAYYQSTLTQRGLCLCCRTIVIDYIISGTHKSQGDSFFGKLSHRCNPQQKEKGYGENLHLKGTGWNFIRDGKIEGYKTESVMGYFCEQCNNAIEEHIKQSEKDREQRTQCNQNIENEHRWDIVMGKVKATPSKRMYALKIAMTNELAKDLSEMKYSEFLNTIYWNIVRKYKLYKSKYKCELCNAKDQLHVHHKTYEHRGCEYRYLDDLIVLCASCHAKFHDKEKR